MSSTDKKNPRQPSLLQDSAKAEREQMIAAAAYYRAQQRGFAPGGELDDWLQAESEVDRFLLGGQPDELSQSQGKPGHR